MPVILLTSLTLSEKVLGAQEKHMVQFVEVSEDPNFSKTSITTTSPQGSREAWTPGDIG